MKLEEVKYTRPNIKETEKMVYEKMNNMKLAGDYPQFKADFHDVNTALRELQGKMTIVSIRNSQNANDTFYEEENKYFDEHSPSIQKMSTDFKNYVSDCTYTESLKADYGKQYFDLASLDKKVINDEVIPLLMKENELSSEYSKLVSQITIEFEGESYNMSGMSPLMENLDRDYRKRATKAFYDELLKHQPKFDEIYDQLTKLRHEIAIKLGYNNFVQLGYDRMGRTCYGPDEIKAYREYVLKYITPRAHQIQKMVAESLGLDTLYEYDKLTFKDGNPVPQTEPTQMIADAQVMYNEMSKETGEFFNEMQEKGMLDLLNRKGKRPGGYCTYVDEVKCPFIFSNFNKTSHDVDVLTHEAGHAFQCYSSMHFDLSEYYFPTSEAAEIHSMSMEFFAWKWIEKFFKQDTDKYKLYHVMKSFTFLPYGVSVDEFQQRNYENPNMTPEQRREVWLEIQGKYMPWIVVDDAQYLKDGGRWQTQAHIFQMPFYYIDYTLAQMCAFQFHIKMQDDFEGAWADYYRLCTKGGSLNFLELVDVANLESPFDENGFKKTADTIYNEIESMMKSYASKTAEA